tara:strand:- start:539 stop:748 length:210 start_codon:yes stop_codon:yes gene_type:complete
MALSVGANTVDEFVDEFGDKYADSWPETVTRSEAIREVKLHHVPVQGFLDELGDREHYKSRAVLIWLGY